MVRNLAILSGMLVAGLFITGCSQQEITPASPIVQPEVPAGFPALANDPHNPLTAEGIELGRLLFYDKRLSGNNKISCASCHRPELSFSDGVALTNAGFSGAVLHRHAPALANIAWAGNGLFWDGGSTNLESQAFGPLRAEDEMHQDLFLLNNELSAVPGYAGRFRRAFNDTVSSANVVKALAQFQRTFVSAGSLYDRFKRKEAGAVLPPEALRGLSLVQQHCQGCHKGELFTDNLYHNNGLDEDFSNGALEGLYQGRYRITRNPDDLGKFKTPTLRNTMVTAPYMHDGRLATINDVLEHYSRGVKPSATLDKLLKQDDGSTGFSLSGADKAAVIAFLGTLTDSSFLTSKKLADPH